MCLGFNVNTLQSLDWTKSGPPETNKPSYSDQQAEIKPSSAWGVFQTNNTDEATVSDHLGQTPKKFHGRTNIGPTVDCVFSITYKLKDHKCTEKIIKAFMGTLNWVTSSSLSLQPTVLAFLDSEGGNCVLKKTYLISTN